MELSPVETAPSRRYLFVLVLAPLLCVLPFAVASYFDPDIVFRVRDLLAGVAVAGIGFYLARRLTR